MDAVHPIVTHDTVSGRPNSIAQIDVFACLEGGVKASHLSKGVCPDGQVAAAKPLDIIHAATMKAEPIVGTLNPVGIRRWHTRSPDRGDAISRDALGGSVDPSAINCVVGVDEGENAACCMLRPGVAQRCHSGPGYKQHPGAGLACDLDRMISRSVVQDDDFNAPGIIIRSNGREAAT
jgi:hypothetical protein